MNEKMFWKAILEQDRDSLPAFFMPDAVIRWHCTNEQFTVPEFIRVNCEYPGEWGGTVERADQQGDQLITVVSVFPKDRPASFHVVSFFKLKDDKISALDEYWADDGDAPAWRKNMGIGKPIR